MEILQLVGLVGIQIRVFSWEAAAKKTQQVEVNDRTILKHKSGLPKNSDSFQWQGGHQKTLQLSSGNSLRVWNVNDLNFACPFFL